MANFSLTNRCYFVSQSVLVSGGIRIFSWTCAKNLSTDIDSNQPWAFKITFENSSYTHEHET
jgi:hypothetical protein